MAEAEPGSFRDRDSRVVITEDAIFRALSPEGAEDWDALAASPLLEQLVSAGDLVPTREVELSELGSADDLLPSGVVKALSHQKIPFVSYPYEWTFSMLRDAALLQLEMGIAAIDNGLMLKDATPYNVQFQGAKAIFIDIGSFEKLPEGDPWIAYRQFCMLYLYPLMFQAYKDIPYHAWLRGAIDGIPPVDAIKVFNMRDRFRKGVYLNVSLHARLERRSTKSGPAEGEKKEVKRTTKPEALKAHMASMKKVIEKMSWKAGETKWSGYRQDNTYSDGDDKAKQGYVSEVVAAEKPGSVWDMGCNDGAYSRIAAESGAGRVVAFDYDHATVEALYRSLRAEGNSKILPLVGNLADPSPGLGWRGLERRTLEDRGAPDLMLALALIHHVSLTANIPLADFLQWVHDLGSTILIEFPKRDDPMVVSLLENKQDGANPDYNLETFEAELEKRFTVDRREELPSGSRVLSLARPR